MIRLAHILALQGMVFWSAVALADGISWNVQPDFRNDQAALEISGALCAGEDPVQNWCYAVNDEKKYIQLFSVVNRTLVPGERLRILEKQDSNGHDWGEPDIEAIAYHRAANEKRHVYLAGSHGASRKKGKVDPSRFFVYRLPVNESGKPAFAISRDDVAPEIERSGKLREIIKTARVVGDFAEVALNDNGANIEGIGVLGDSIYFGFRAPVVQGRAAILEAGIDTLFGNSVEDAAFHSVDIGAGYGIRDMAQIDGQFLILAGAAQEADLVPTIWSWAPNSHPRLLSVLRVPAMRKPESLMILDRSGTSELRVLVLFDGEKNGAPVEFTIPRP